MRIVPTSMALVVALLLTTLSTALASEWVVRKANQPARYSTDGVVWTPLMAGMVVPEGSTVFTGRRGRVLLGRDTETILFTPNTLAAIAKPNRSGFVTEIIQKVGRLVLEVKKQEQPRTRVRTPFLAAVVKGTRFEVRVGRQSALVKVRNGVVQVTELKSGERSELRARQTATVSIAFSEPLRVRGPGRRTPLTRVKPSSPVVEPLAVERDRALAKPTGRRTSSIPAVVGASKTQKPEVDVPSMEPEDSSVGDDGTTAGGEGRDGANGGDGPGRGTGTDGRDGTGGTDSGDGGHDAGVGADNSGEVGGGTAGDGGGGTNGGGETGGNGGTGAGGGDDGDVGGTDSGGGDGMDSGDGTGGGGDGTDSGGDGTDSGGDDTDSGDSGGDDTDSGDSGGDGGTGVDGGDGGGGGGRDRGDGDGGGENDETGR